jgi:hypothetical protein
VSGTRLFVVRVAITIGVAAISYHFLEAPIRFGRSRSRPRLIGAFAVAALLLAVLVTQMPTHASNAIDLSGSPAQAKRPYIAPGATYLLVVGDSVAYTTLHGLFDWSDAHPKTPLAVGTKIVFGCPVSGPATVRFNDNVQGVYPQCKTFVADTTALLRETHPKSALVLQGLGDVADHRFTNGPLADGKWHHIGEPAFDRWEMGKIRYAVDSFDSVGVPIMWATYPDLIDKDANGNITSESDPNRVRIYDAMLAEAIWGTHHSKLIDLAGMVRRFPGGEFSPGIRADGLHWSPSGSDYVANWLAPQLLQAAHHTSAKQPSRQAHP